MASRSSVQSGRAFVFGVEGRRRGKGPSPRASGGARAVRRRIWGSSISESPARPSRSDDYFYGSRRNRYRNYEDEDEEDDEEDGDDDADFTVATVDDTWQYVDEWRDTDDRVVEFGRIPLDRRRVAPGGRARRGASGREAANGSFGQ